MSVIVIHVTANHPCGQSDKVMSDICVSPGYKLAFNYMKAKRFVDAIDICHHVSGHLAHWKLCIRNRIRTVHLKNQLLFIFAIICFM